MLLGVGGRSRWSHGCKTKRITSKLALWGYAYISQKAQQLLPNATLNLVTITTTAVSQADGKSFGRLIKLSTFVSWTRVWKCEVLSNVTIRWESKEHILAMTWKSQEHNDLKKPGTQTPAERNLILFQPQKQTINSVIEYMAIYTSNNVIQSTYLQCTEFINYSRDEIFLQIVLHGTNMLYPRCEIFKLDKWHQIWRSHNNMYETGFFSHLCCQLSRKITELHRHVWVSPHIITLWLVQCRHAWPA
jgi:hypothetical protein